MQIAEDRQFIELPR